MNRSKLAILKVGEGNLQSTGFPVTLQIGWEGESPFLTTDGQLPPAPDLVEAHATWRAIYRCLDDNRRLEVPNFQVTNGSEINECNDAAQPVLDALNRWLNSPSFRKIRETLLSQIKPEEVARAILQTDDRLLHQLPWHLWSFFEDYENIELTLSFTNSRQVESPSRQNERVKILAIFGSDIDIDTEYDRRAINSLPNTETTVLDQPERREFNNALWESSWDILFFAGHSHTEKERGVIALNPEDRLTLDDLKYALRRAINAGLKIAIFNSCDGTGLARKLAELNIPQLIIMREPVPDLVAREFLQNLLQEYVRGESLAIAVRRAREKLQGLELEFPCATWLPVLYQNPLEIPPTWQQLARQKTKRFQSRFQHDVRVSLRASALLSLAVTMAVLSVRQWGWLQSWELNVYDRTLRLRPDEGVDSRLLVITLDESDLSYQDARGFQRKGSLADATLEKIFKTLEPLHPRVIGLDIYRDFTVGKNHPQLARQLREMPYLIAACKQDDLEAENAGVKPPPEVPTEGLGFSDFVVDADGILRRYLWYASTSSNSPCPSEISFSLKLVLSYLNSEGIPITPNAKTGELRLGNLTLFALKERAGGYQQFDDRGRQILLNYRSRRVAETLSLTDLLKGQFDPNLIRDRIILIGTIAPSFPDNHFTPYSRDRFPNESTRGVFIHAQMVSQILGAVLDKRPLLNVLPAWGDAIWIGIWAGAGAFIAVRVRNWRIFGLTIAIAIVLLAALYFILFLGGVWVPFLPSLFSLLLAASATLIRSELNRRSQPQLEPNRSAPPA